MLPGGGFQKAYSTTHGISQTDSETISAELGIDAGGLSAKLTATFEHSVTTSNENSEMTTFTAGAPEAGLTRVWLIWQLVDELVALDPSNNILPEGGFGKGDVWWAGPFFGSLRDLFVAEEDETDFSDGDLCPGPEGFPERPYDISAAAHRLTRGPLTYDVVKNVESGAFSRNRALLACLGCLPTQLPEPPRVTALR